MSASRVDRVVEHLVCETAKIIKKKWPTGMMKEEIAAAAEREMEEAWEGAKLASARFSGEEQRQFPDELNRVAQWLRGKATGDERHN